ncbi:hypothetical protein ANANG_G00130480 [Anguilla anguilla]|uniref:RNA polymerase II elongation factor ELL N-terminal domain-containing protein n=1 Tax=Anguilla anguilla TaxID=7936 RepID=A0A9D3S0A6_ANGAN|nr:hypothetical protein ANANG_G00130480 [Anguilla anguilla]
MKDGLSTQDKDALDSLLQEVANLNGRDSTFTLKDGLFKELQTGWPGYSEGDQQLLSRILKRKLCQSQSSLLVPGVTPGTPPKEPASCSPSQKRPAGDFIDPLANKKPRISHLASKPAGPPNGKLSSSNGKEAGAVGGAQAAAAAVVTTSGTALVARSSPCWSCRAPATCDLLSDLGHTARVATRARKRRSDWPRPPPALPLEPRPLLPIAPPICCWPRPLSPTPPPSCTASPRRSPKAQGQGEGEGEREGEEGRKGEDGRAHGQHRWPEEQCFTHQHRSEWNL